MHTVIRCKSTRGNACSYGSHPPKEWDGTPRFRRDSMGGIWGGWSLLLYLHLYITTFCHVIVTGQIITLFSDSVLVVGVFVVVYVCFCCLCCFFVLLLKFFLFYVSWCFLQIICLLTYR